MPELKCCVTEKTTQALYVKRNIEARSCHYYCCGKVVSATYSKCVFVALDIQHAMLMRYIILLSASCHVLQ